MLMRSVFSLLAVLALLTGCASSGTATLISPREANLLGKIAELQREVEARERERAQGEQELAERNRELADLNERLKRTTRREAALVNRCEAKGPAVSATRHDTGLYVVQIGSFRRAPSDFGARAAKVGTLSTTVTPSGLTRFQVGSFRSEHEARQAQSRLRAAGYADAFVRQVDPATATHAEPPAMSAGTSQAPPRASGFSLGPG
jgi:hypothetical protein